MRTVALLLAAGTSERLGTPKALIDWNGQPLLQHQIHQIQKSRIAECIVVLGHGADRLEPMVHRPFRPGWKARAVRNPRYAEGKCSSIRFGLMSLLRRPEGLLVASVDQPLEHRLIDALIAAAEREWRSGSDNCPEIVLPAHEGRRGHPVLFRGTLLPELLGVREETEGLKTVVRRLPERVREVPWDSGQILLNLNTPLDVARVADEGRDPIQPRR